MILRSQRVKKENKCFSSALCFHVWYKNVYIYLPTQPEQDVTQGQFLDRVFLLLDWLLQQG